MEKIKNDFNMGKGEASIIAAALENKGKVIITDNKQGRKAATIHNLPLAGSIEIIIDLYKKKKINSQKALEALQIIQEVGWFHPYLIEKAQEDIQ